MPIDATNLLRRLHPPVRTVERDSTNQRLPVDLAGFDDLLTLVSRGEVHSGLPVLGAPGDAPDAALTAEQGKRLGDAADTASAAGFRRAVVMLDDRSFLLHVVQRTIERELRSGGEADAIDVDGAVFAASSDGSPVSPPRGPANVLPPLVVLDQLEAARAAQHTLERTQQTAA